jgi:hypothetical protein
MYFPTLAHQVHLDRLAYSKELRWQPGQKWIDFGRVAAARKMSREDLHKEMEEFFVRAVRMRDALGVNAIWMSIGQSINDRDEDLYSRISGLILPLIDDLSELYYYQPGSAVIGPDGRLGKPAASVVTGVSVKLAEAISKEPELLRKITPRGFEELLADVFTGFGYNVELTAQSRDGGRDIIAIGNKHDVLSKLLIECKHYAPHRLVGLAHVRALYGVKTLEHATKALLATTSRFTKDARKIEKQHIYELGA